MLGLSYALGLLWYDLLPGKLPQLVWPDPSMRCRQYPRLPKYGSHVRSRG